jgi:anti-anti-sigma factor
LFNSALSATFRESGHAGLLAGVRPESRISGPRTSRRAEIRDRNYEKQYFVQEARVQVEVRRDQDLLIVTVDGRIDTVSAPDFQQKMEEALDQGEKKIVMDLERLEYISSAGLRSILFTAKKAKAAGGTVACCSLQTMVKKVFEVSGFASMIPVFGSLDEAVKSR